MLHAKHFEDVTKIFHLQTLGSRGNRVLDMLTVAERRYICGRHFQTEKAQDD
jgi:hypothetical protein